MSNKLGITWNDMKDRWNGGPLLGDDEPEGDVDAAVRFLLRKLPLLEQWVTQGVVDRADVIDVVFPAVARVLRNPEGYERESDGSYSYGMSSLSASANVWIPDSDWQTLIPYSPLRPGTTGRIGITRGWGWPA
ncbi:Gp19/Gp15/Gp42 family protein [Brachybacterium kimchii]|uniref:Phage Gp19/Gp15/Gp42 family protein n=1 Tax=Brachybacterium kimchii TaxID=2942909 RepID=A0ABY4N7X6_9MICO|nr:Gp19/Gp15/Gp42 family protein [Brachybacterium kimchii]UQN30659.1 phage Gp19/Gp15/Gp42 family protein [Brachybacterium kimchii]